MLKLCLFNTPDNLFRITAYIITYTKMLFFLRGILYGTMNLRAINTRQMYFLG